MISTKYKKIIFPLLSVTATGILFSCGNASRDQAGTSGRKPNIVYILADDLGYAQLGCYGQQKIETPNIDALAANGMIFTQHYSGAPLCAPSRCVLLTGKHTGHAQIRANDEWGKRGEVWDYVKTQENPELEGQYPLKAGTQTIASILQKEGYKTALVGKWGLGGPETEGAPNKLGFDFFFGHNCQRQAWNYYPRYLWKDTIKVWLNNELIIPGTKDKKAKLPKGADPKDENSYSAFSSNEYAPERMQKEAIVFIRENKEQPFFLYYATPIPHAALQAPKHWIDHYREKFGDEEPYSGEKNYFPTRYPHATYAAMVSYLDEQVGELVTILKELGLYENTLIIFASDNGPANAGGSDSPWFDSAKPFKCGPGWGKGELTEGGIRVPMIAHWSGRIKAGQQTNLISAFYDVLPTLCDVAEIETPHDSDGISFLPTLLGEKKQRTHDFLYWEFPGAGGQQAIRMEKWKGVRRNILKDSLRVQLYNLDEDIQELTDVSSRYPEIVQQMEKLFEQEHQTPENETFRMKTLGD
ncbi:MAG TPA: N-acetylgalactosamine-6-sulfatase [Prolixibacteraceae bacterium]|nr:N-acetylgalactosamine-6-sulfatase [Marinilabiliales bacterium]HBL78158.1 N-acetylgalactosamine-6-sulfatase [Prolixibacteraceae bacterium]HCU61142.1 N-acetylgalactosamine-6-sulfatase [Prolixibacteraceae bacterium]